MCVCTVHIIQIIKKDCISIYMYSKTYHLMTDRQQMNHFSESNAFKKVLTVSPKHTYAPTHSHMHPQAHPS